MGTGPGSSAGGAEDSSEGAIQQPRSRRFSSLGQSRTEPELLPAFGPPDAQMTPNPAPCYPRKRVRPLCLVLFGLAAGCASTVQRLDGEVPTRTGLPRNDCEKEAWLVLVPTRYQEVNEDGRTTSPRNDGLGLYQLGASRPESIPARARELGDSPLVDRHVAGAHSYDRQQLAAGLFAGTGLVVIGIGTGLFVSAFGERHVTVDGVPTTRQEVNTTLSIGGAILGGVGLALGIAGLVISPSHAERAEGEAARYAFQPPTDDRKAVRELVATHNGRVRDRCHTDAPAPPASAAAPSPAPSVPAEPIAPSPPPQAAPSASAPPPAEPAPPPAVPDAAPPSGD
jgi:hypothetical protein